MTFAELIADRMLTHLARLEKDFLQVQQVRALKQRHKWRSSDLARLQQLDLPAWVDPHLQDLASSKRLGRGVVKEVQTLEGRICAYFPALKLLADPTTPPHIRRQLYKCTSWFPEFVEAAYRGELRRLQEQSNLTRRASTKASNRRLFKVAEKNVADAACISTALVRKYCHEVRKTCCEASLGPATGAAELKEHLERGPGLIRDGVKGQAH